jgi:hypothetical protein
MTEKLVKVRYRTDRYIRLKGDSWSYNSNGFVVRDTTESCLLAVLKKIEGDSSKLATRVTDLRTNNSTEIYLISGGNIIITREQHEELGSPRPIEFIYPSMRRLNGVAASLGLPLKERDYKTQKMGEAVARGESTSPRKN